MHSLLQRCGAEALGTFVLVAVGPGAALVSASTNAFGHGGVALAFGLAVTIVVASIGHISGAHINPAVTTALWSSGGVPGREVPPYVASQLVGAVLASLFLHMVVKDGGTADATVPRIALGSAFLVEAGYSALLAFVIARVIDNKNETAFPAAPLLGATVFAGALVTGPLTGGSFNPARTLGPAIAGNVWNSHWLYWIAPILGMVAGMWLYRVVSRRQIAVDSD